MAHLRVQPCNVGTVDAYEIHEEARFHSLVLIMPLLRNKVVFMLRIHVHDIFEICCEHTVQGHRSAFEFDNLCIRVHLIAMVSFTLLVLSCHV